MTAHHAHFPPDWLPADLRKRLAVYGVSGPHTRLIWLAERSKRAHAGHIGSTGVAAVLGVSAFSTPWDMWRRVHSEEARERATWTGADWYAYAEAKEAERASNQDDLDRGNFWEPHIIEWAQRYYAASWSPVTTVTHHDGWLTVSPDAYALDEEHGPGIEEVKTARYSAGWGPDGAEIKEAPSTANVAPLHLVPRYYLTQAYAHLAATGLGWCDLIVPLALHDIRRIRVWRSEWYQDWLVNTVGEWRHKHIVNGEQPPVDGSDACRDELAAAFLRTLPKTGEREATPGEATLMEEEQRLLSEKQAAEAAQQAVRNQLLSALVEARTRRVWVKGGPSATVSAAGRLSVRSPK